MGAKLSLDPWFLWTFIVLRVLVPVLALLWLWDLWRRPEWQFQSSWPMPKVRWGVVPVAFLVTVAIGFIPHTPAGIRSALDLTVIVLILGMLFVGVAYLLRVVFPSAKRVEERRAMAAEMAGDGEDTDPADDASAPETEADDHFPEER